MPVDGPKAGRLMFMTTPDSANGTTNASRPKKASGGPLTPAERIARLERRRDAYLVKFVESHLRKVSDEELGRIARHLDRANRPKGEPPADIFALVLAFGTSTRKDRHADGDAWADYDRLRTKSDTVRTIYVLRELLPIWVRRLSGVDGSTAAAQATEAKRICKAIGLDYAAIEVETAKAIPIPKSWSVRP